MVTEDPWKRHQYTLVGLFYYGMFCFFLLSSKHKHCTYKIICKLIGRTANSQEPSSTWGWHYRFAILWAARALFIKLLPLWGWIAACFLDVFPLPTSFPDSVPQLCMCVCDSSVLGQGWRGHSCSADQSTPSSCLLHRHSRQWLWSCFSVRILKST